MRSAIRRARVRLLRMHYHAGVGHLGGNLSALDAMMVLHHQILHENDRFVLSKGHAAGALYIVLWSMGLLTDADLDSFHGEGTHLPGHPPAGAIDGIRFATGSLGHGMGLAAGAALAARFHNRDAHIYCMTSDGEWEEGACWETLLFAAHHRLANMTVMIDCNGLQGFGTTAEVASLEPLQAKLDGFGVDVAAFDGHDVPQLASELAERGKGRPRILLLRTHKGEGVSFMRDRMEWHYLPLNQAQLEQALQELGGEP